MKTILTFFTLFFVLNVAIGQPPCLPSQGGIHAGNEAPGCLMDTITGGSNQGYGPSPPGSALFPCGTIDNNIFISVHADSFGSICLQIFFANCQNGNGLQAIIYDQNFNPVSNCTGLPGNPGPGDLPQPFDTIYAENLVPGEIYWLMLDGWNGDICDFLIQKITPCIPPPSPDAFRIIPFFDQNGNSKYDSLAGEFFTKVGKFQKIENSDTLNFYYNGGNDFYLNKIDIGTTFKISYTGQNDFPLWEPSFTDTIISFDINTPNPFYFPLKKLVDCPKMTLDIQAGRFSSCRQRTVTITYQNEGTSVANSAALKVLLPSELIYVSSDLPIAQQLNDTLFFDLGDVNPGDFNQTNILVEVGCSNTFANQGLCIEAFITPDDICAPPGNGWNGAWVEAERQCLNNEVKFILTNPGTAATGDLEYRILENDSIIEKTIFNLAAGQSLEVIYPANENTYRISADQVADFPGKSPSLAVEGCGATDNNHPVGFLNTFANDFAANASDIYCERIFRSYDPNDKNAYPRGYSDRNFIEKETDLEYLIRFQNTGNDTAFNVEILDTLSPLLDMRSVRLLNSSHPCTLEDKGNRALSFNFPDIFLVDSITNEPLSHGFVKFRVSPLPGLEEGTEIFNTADIYFDFNPPIKTNTVLRTIEENFVPSSAKNIINERFDIKVTPNPFSDFTDIEVFSASSEITKNVRIEVFSLSGKMIFSDSFSGNNYRLKKNNLSQGLHIFKLKTSTQTLGIGKVLIF